MSENKSKNFSKKLPEKSPTLIKNLEQLNWRSESQIIQPSDSPRTNKSKITAFILICALSTLGYLFYPGKNKSRESVKREVQVPVEQTKHVAAQLSVEKPKLKQNHVKQKKIKKQAPIKARTPAQINNDQVYDDPDRHSVDQYDAYQDIY